MAGVMLIKGFTFAPASSIPIVKAIAAWGLSRIEGRLAHLVSERRTTPDASPMPAKVAMKPSSLTAAEPFRVFPISR